MKPSDKRKRDEGKSRLRQEIEETIRGEKRVRRELDADERFWLFFWAIIATSVVIGASVVTWLVVSRPQQEDSCQTRAEEAVDRCLPPAPVRGADEISACTRLGEVLVAGCSSTSASRPD